MTLLFQKLLKLQENKDNQQKLNLLKKILWNLIIGSNNQNQTIDSKLNINRNNLRRRLHQSIFENAKAVFKFVALIQKSTCREVSSCT